MFARLRAIHPDARCELGHEGSFELLVATVLSAQTTDVRVNQVTPGLFERWPTPGALADASPDEVATFLVSKGLGMQNQKAKNIIGLSAALVRDHGGVVPSSLEKLVRLPGVGRKTGNVVLGVAFGAPEGVVVDTHVQRVAQRLGWTRNTDPERIEKDLCAVFPRSDWDALAHVLIFHGRRICAAVKPSCASCGVNDACPSAFHAEKVGRKQRPAAPLGPTKATPRSRPTKAGSVTKGAAKPKKAAAAAEAPAKPKKAAASKNAAAAAKPVRATRRGRASTR